MAGGAVRSEGFRVVVYGDVVLADDRLAVCAHDEAYEVSRNAGRLALGRNVERTGQGVVARLYVVNSRLNAVNRNRLNGVVQRAEGNVADRRFVARNRGQDRVGAVCDLGLNRGVVAVVVLNAGQLDKRAAGARAVLTGYDMDRAGSAGGALRGLGVRILSSAVVAAAACQCAAQHQAGQQQGNALLHGVISPLHDVLVFLLQEHLTEVM